MVLNRDKTVHVFSSSSEIGRVVDEIFPLKVQGIDQFQVAFSARYFLEALRAFESQEVTMKLTGELKPFLITGKNDDNLVQLILPVRTF
jgi:DNA polymerase-3 subunit beta